MTDTQEQILLHETERRMKNTQILAGLITCIDVCDAMAQMYLGNEQRGGIRYMSVVRQVHDIAHVLAGGDKTLSWHTVKAMIEHEDERAAFGPAWPDVRRRMAELIERLEGLR